MSAKIINKKSEAGNPVHWQLLDQILAGIASGKLTIGEQLPTARSLAVELKVNLNTVTKAYKELRLMNVLENYQRPESLIIKNNIVFSEKEKHLKLLRICSEFIAISYNYGFTLDEMIYELQIQKTK